MSRPLIVETVTARSAADLRAHRDAASLADLVELRLDLLDRPDADAALAGRTRPVIVTCRAAWEGGGFRGEETERVAILRRALALGADYVDLEWRSPDAMALLDEQTRRRVIVSLHDFEGIPSDLEELAAAMRSSGAAIVKLAVTPGRLADLVRLLALGRSWPQDGETRLVLIAMGTCGLPTRLLPGHFGSCWTYAGNGVAPGQVPVSRLIHEFGFRRVTPATPVYAIAGRPVGHSVSPAMHNAAFAAHGIDAVYIPCEPADFDDFLAFAEALPIAGASVTAPFKEAAAAAAQAEPGTALNTLRRQPGGGWAGLNTDIDGFMAPLAGERLQGMRAAVIGAGGSARAVVTGLTAAGARVTVHARRPEAARKLAEAFGAQAGAWPVEPGSWDLLVNTTPVGTFPDVDASPLAGLPLDGRLVYDLIYNPRPTRLLRDAAASGCRTIDGLEMLVQQAVRQFAWWTGVTPAASLLRQAAERRLAEMAPLAPAGQ
ncbi:MAG TPA: type I 3-dehydroquinate dehydratase [Vicinamibacterales bacterium]